MQYSWQECIYTKCKNINRKSPGSSDGESTEPSAKQSKLENCTLQSYPSIDVGLEDEESNKRNLSLLVAEVQESNPSTTRVKELMWRTFHQRRKWILVENNTVQAICEKYPVLKMSCYVINVADYYFIIEFYGIITVATTAFLILNVLYSISWYHQNNIALVS